ncbi:MAG: rhomboid family intramembrane serine protease [Isosphaeraceae bacterium]
MKPIQIALVLGLVVILSSAAWVWVDVRRQRTSTFGGSFGAGAAPWVWAFGCVFVWFLIFPAYLLHRHQILSRRRRRREAEARFDSLLRQEPPVDLEESAAEGVDPWDLVAIGASQRFRGQETVHMAPGISGKLVAQARTYLWLEPGELLLAIIDPNEGRMPGGALALTTRKLHGYRTGSRGLRLPADDPARQANRGLGQFGLAFRGVSIPYRALGGRFAEQCADPDEPRPSAAEPPEFLDLADGRQVALRNLDPDLIGPLGRFLQAVGPAARRGRPALPAPLAQQARALLPDLKAQSEGLVEAQRGMMDFQSALNASTRRVLVTPALVAACVAVFAAMVAGGVSPVEPTTQHLVDWGANFGPYVAVDREYWRLFTSMFLHIGAIHLAFNMWCLAVAGPMVERFFGNLGFAAVYLLSGLGGAVASLAVHPFVVSAGASGAIFGIFGALLGFLLARHQSIPARMLRPLRASAFSFVGYNILLGLTSPQIDNAAHLGGLATGFACGLLLSRRLPVVPGQGGILRRLAATAGLAVALGLFTRHLTDHLATDRQVRSASRESNRLAESYNALVRATAEPGRRYEHVRGELNRLLERLQSTGVPKPGDAALVGRLSQEVSSAIDALRAVTVGDPELRRILDADLACQRAMRETLGELRKLLTRSAGDPEPDPEPFQKSLDAANRAADDFVALRNKFPKDHGLVPRAPGPAPAPAAESPAAGEKGPRRGG